MIIIMIFISISASLSLSIYIYIYTHTYTHTYILTCMHACMRLGFWLLDAWLDRTCTDFVCVRGVGAAAPLSHCVIAHDCALVHDQRKRGNGF